MQKITQHIVKLLHDHNYVIVPGFGGFVTNYQPAKVHPTSFIFNSPSKSVAFNVNLTSNDGLLINTIAIEQKIAITPQDVETVEQQVTETWQKIQNREFYTGCGKPECYWCNFVKENKLQKARYEHEEQEE